MYPHATLHAQIHAFLFSPPNTHTHTHTHTLTSTCANTRALRHTQARTIILTSPPTNWARGIFVYKFSKAWRQQQLRSKWKNHPFALDLTRTTQASTNFKFVESVRTLVFFKIEWKDYWVQMVLLRESAWEVHGFDSNPLMPRNKLVL